MGWFRRWYGAQPLHLLALIAAFALAGYAVRGVVAAGQWRGFALWFAVAIVGHDLLLFPLYSLADLSVRRLLPGRPGARRRDTPTPNPGPAHSGAAHPAASRSATQAAPAAPAGPVAPSVINYLRVPAAFSLLLLLVWFPLILGLSEHNYHRASGLVTSPYLGRWLAVTGVLFAASAASYALALRRASAPARRARPSHHPASSPGGPGRSDGTRHASRHRRHRIH